MIDLHFPPANGNAAQLAFERDPLYGRLSEEEKETVFKRARELGVTYANRYYLISPNLIKLLREEGIQIVVKNTDYVAGGVRFFSEYISGKKLIVLYVQSINKWAIANSMDFASAKCIFLAHEFFHYLECEKIGLTSNMMKFPLFHLAGIPIGSRGLRSLCEVAAISFSERWQELVTEKGTMDRNE